MLLYTYIYILVLYIHSIGDDDDDDEGLWMCVWVNEKKFNSNIYTIHTTKANLDLRLDEDAVFTRKKKLSEKKRQHLTIAKCVYWHLTVLWTHTQHIKKVISVKELKISTSFTTFSIY